MRLKKITLNNLQIIPMLFAFGILCACENDVKEIESLSSTKDQPISKGLNVTFLYSEEARVKINVAAPLMEEYGLEKNKYMEMKDGITVNFYDTLMKVSSTLTANYAINKVAKKVMEAKDNVVIVNSKGEVLHTEHLVWVQDSVKIYTDEFVKITTTDEIIMGEGMEANQDFTKWKIRKIKGIINLKEDETNTTN